MLTPDKKPPVPDYDLKWLREYADYSQQEAADVLKVSRVSYSNWERGISSTPPRVLASLAAAIGCDVSIIPPNLAQLVKREAEAATFAREAKVATEKANALVARSVTGEHTAGAVPSLPPIEIPTSKFLPSTMKKFNVPVERWSEFVRDKAGEDSNVLRKAGYSWDQAVEWRSPEARMQAYTLLKVWEEARNRHFAARARHARGMKIAMPPMVYAEIVRLFDELLEAQGWGLV